MAPVPLSQLVAINPDQSTAEAIGDWHYRVAQGYCFWTTPSCPLLRSLAESTRITQARAGAGESRLKNPRKSARWGP